MGIGSGAAAGGSQPGSSLGPRSQSAVLVPPHHDRQAGAKLCKRGQQANAAELHCCRCLSAAPHDGP